MTCMLHYILRYGVYGMDKDSGLTARLFKTHQARIGAVERFLGTLDALALS